jgi:hypothetical protein
VKPIFFRQISGEPMPSAFNFTHLFHAKRNRVEFISDFAPTNDAEVISRDRFYKTPFQP